MKKPILLGIIGITIAALTATTLYAQTTTGTSIIDKMKEAVHTFTLGTQLGQTGLESAPILGKKTGDILTAGEWNRMLELMAQGAGISNVELVISQAASPSATADYSFRVSQVNCPAGKKVISGGCSYPNTLNTFVHNTPTTDLTGWLCGGLHHDGDTTNNPAKYPYRPTAYAMCGEYGGGGVGSGWTNVPLTGGDNFDDQCMYRFKLSSSTLFNYTEVVGTDAIYWYADGTRNIYIAKGDKTILADSAAASRTVTKIEKLCGGGGGSTSGGAGEMVMSEMSPTTYSNLIDAVNYCRNLTENGITNWKFPTYGDLVNFISSTYSGDFLWVADFDTSAINSTNITKDYFASMRLSDGYWSVSTPADGANKVRCVAQTGGGSGGGGALTCTDNETTYSAMTNTPKSGDAFCQAKNETCVGVFYSGDPSLAEECSLVSIPGKSGYTQPAKVRCCSGGGSGGGGDSFTFLDTEKTLISGGPTTANKAATTLDISTIAGVTIPPRAKAIQVYVQCNNYTEQNQATMLFLGKSTTSLFSACQSNGMLSANDVDSNSLIVPLAPDGKSIAYKYNMPSSDSGGQIVVSLRGFITE